MGTTQAFLVETQSGLTMAAFARRESLAYSTFAGWVWKSDRRGGRGQATARPVRFAQVQLPPPASSEGLEVRLIDGTVLRGGNGVELAALVRALRA